MAPPRIAPPEPAVVLYDEDCAFCRATVRFLRRRDHAHRLTFVPLQSPQARKALACHGLPPAAFSSVVLLEGLGIEIRSTAALRLFCRLGWPWRALALALVIPRPLRDWLYDRIAAHRHRFGR